MNSVVGVAAIYLHILENGDCGRTRWRADGPQMQWPTSHYGDPIEKHLSST
jgi:hypothetical protein